MSTQTAAQVPATGLNRTILFVVLVSGLGGILYGFDIGVISGALVFMKPSLSISTTQADLIVAAVLYGGAVATLFSGPFADRFGRRFSINVSGVIFIIGVVVLLVAHSFDMVMVGRLVQGVGIGIITIVVPLYLAETLPSLLRGRGIALFQLCLTFGILLGYLVNFALKSTGDWRLMFATILVPGVLFLLGGLFLLPRSPRWLYQHGHEAEARDVLVKTEGAERVGLALEEIKTVIEEERKQQKHTGGGLGAWLLRAWESWSLLFHKGYRKAFGIALGVGILNQLSGINVLLQFNATILGDSGLHHVAFLGSVFVGAVNFVVTIVALLLVDKLGRRPLLIIGTAGVTAALVFIGLIHIFFPPSLFTGYATLAGFIAFVVFFAVGPGVVVWLAISEILPLAIRAKGMAVALFANSLVSALLATVFLDVAKSISLGGTFLVLAFFTSLYLLIAIFPLPETKGRTLEEIENDFLKGTVKP